ncbi:MAG: hypothetical protein M3T56_03235 [Chloroflexota bacterium]|nr:hypothetical protein [Chloroflexota bacterium]
MTSPKKKTGSDHQVRVYAEMVRRKGLSVKDAQLLPEKPEPWYVQLTWNKQEEEDFYRWFKSWSVRTLHVSAHGFDHDLWITKLTYALHRRDICDITDHHHAEAAEADLPRRRWLPVASALVTLPKNEWPK